MKTKAAILNQLNRPLKIAAIDVPKLKVGQVLVEIHYSAICRSQLNEIKGFKGKDKYLPHLLGHEGSGLVLKIGPQVSKVRPADHVILSWIKGKGHDAGSTQYRYGNQIINSGPIATFAQFAVISENRLTKITPELPFDVAALLGCTLATGAGIVRHTLKLNPSSTLVVFGVGGIGSGVILGSLLVKCRQVVAVDINDRALKFASKLGASQVLNFNSPDIDSKLKHLFPEGSDYAVEASGNKAAMEKAFTIIKDNGVAVIAGNLRQSDTICLNPFDLIKGKRIIGTWGGEANPDIDFLYYAQKYLEGKLKLDHLITHELPLEKINTALEKLDKHQSTGRYLIKFN